MKPGYTTHRESEEILKRNECIMVWNYRKYNEYVEVPLTLEKVARLRCKDTIGVWTKKGIKRPDNWPNKKRIA